MVLKPIHSLHRTLLDLGICGLGSLQKLSSPTRDRPEINAHRCAESGVVLLDRIDHIGNEYYPAKEHEGLASSGSRSALVKNLTPDTERRAINFGPLLKGQDWLDIGTGAGGILDRLNGEAATISAVEPQGEFHQLLRSEGYLVYRDIRDVPTDSVDVATMFHVFEHLTMPLEDLTEIARVLRPGGKVLVEVPHAKDALLARYDCQAFEAFTLWSEHLLLHTRESLFRFLDYSGFSKIEISGIQRYSLANTLHWLSAGRPNGQAVWPDLLDHDLDKSYERKLDELDLTDTLIAEAELGS